VLVAPAGDGGGGPDTVNYPAAYPGVISVGAFDKTFAKAPFTSTRPYVTLTGPGNGVIAANGTAGYAKLNSTTAASAVVAGIAGLIRAQFPTLTPAQITTALTSSTGFHPQGGRRDGSGFGTVDAAAALTAAAKINATLSSSSSPANPTPPAAPKVKVHTQSLWDALRYPVLGLAALLLLALIVLITVRTRQRRALNAELAPLRAAAQAGRRQSANGVADSDLASASAGLGSGVPFGPGGAAVDLAATGRRTAGRAPFDDPDFVPPSFRTAAFGQTGFGPPGAAQGGFGGAAAGGSEFGAASAGAAAFGSTLSGLPARGNAAADLPVRGSAAADFPAFGHAAGAPFAGPAGPGAAGPAQPSEAALADGAAFGRPAAADPPVPQLRTLGSAHRLSALRTPKTTGHPPWEPAEKPEGELPWMDTPARGGAPGRVVPPRPYPGAEPGGPGQRSGDQVGGPRSGGPTGPYPGDNSRGRGRRGSIDRGPFPELDPPPGADLDGQATPRPRHSWNPGENTDSFPAVRPDDSQLS
jgi:Subtilase family